MSKLKKPSYHSDHVLYDVHSYDVDLQTNQVFLMGSEEYAGFEYMDTGEPGIEYTMTNRFVRNMNMLMTRSDDPILIHMKTCGGWWTEGMAIYDIIKNCPSYITILNYTHARSMSSIILQAADKRVMMPHSSFMFHNGTMGYEGTVKQYLNEAEQLQKASKQMIEIYIDSMKASGKYSHWSRQKINNWLESEMNKKEEVYLNAQEAVNYGFADEVFDGNWNGLTKY